MVGYFGRRVDWPHFSLEGSYIACLFSIAVLNSSPVPTDAFVYA